MSVARKLVALLENLTIADVRALPPAERQRFAQELKHVAGWAESLPKEGVLALLRSGSRAQ